jgi:hypothetical protein
MPPSWSPCSRHGQTGLSMHFEQTGDRALSKEKGRVATKEEEKVTYS